MITLKANQMTVYDYYLYTKITSVHIITKKRYRVLAGDPPTSKVSSDQKIGHGCHHTLETEDY